MSLNKVSLLVFVGLAILILSSTGSSAKVMISSVSCPGTVYQGDTAEFTVDYYKDGWFWESASGYIGASISVPYGSKYDDGYNRYDGWDDFSYLWQVSTWFSDSVTFYKYIPDDYPTGTHTFYAASWDKKPGWGSGATRWDTDSCTFTVKQKSNPPSFSVKSISGSLYPGKSSKIKVKVHNSGGSGTAKVKLYINNNYYSSSSKYINSGDSEYLYFYWTPGSDSYGNVKVEAKVYYNENEQASNSVYIRIKDAFSVSRTSFPSGTHHPGDSLSFNSRVYNSGYDNTAYVRYKIYGNGKTWYTGYKSKYVSSGSYSWVGSISWSIPSNAPEGSYKVCAQVSRYSDFKHVDDTWCDSNVFRIAENNPKFEITGVSLYGSSKTVYKPGDKVRIKVSYKNTGGPGKAYIGGAVVKPDEVYCNTEFKSTGTVRAGGKGSVIIDWTVPAGYPKGNYGFITTPWKYCHNPGAVGSCYNGGGCSDPYATETKASNLFKIDNPPEIYNYNSKYEIKEGQTLCINPKARDPDGDKVSISLPNAFKNNKCWTPGFGVVAKNGQKTTQLFTIVASSGYLTTTKSFKVIVSNQNLCPTIGSIPDQKIREGDTIYLPKNSISVNDPDQDLLTITYGSPLNRYGKWVTGAGDAGTYNTYVQASDGYCSVKSKFSIRVDPDHAPTLTGVPNTFKIRPGDTFQFNAERYNPTDPDGDTISYQFGPPLDSNGRFTPTTTGNYHTYVKVYSRVRSNTYPFTIKVVANQPPYLVSKSITGDMIEGKQVKITLLVRDPDGDKLIMTKPAGVNFDKTEYTSEGGTYNYTYYWTPSEPAIYELNFKVSDGRNTTTIKLEIQINPSQPTVPAGIMPFQPQAGNSEQNKNTTGGGMSPMLPITSAAGAYALYLASKRRRPIISTKLKRVVYKARKLTLGEQEYLQKENFENPPPIKYLHEKWVSLIKYVRSAPAKTIKLPEYDPEKLNMHTAPNGQLVTAEQLASMLENRNPKMNTRVELGVPYATISQADLNRMRTIINRILKNKDKYDTNTLNNTAYAINIYKQIQSGAKLTDAQYAQVQALFNQLSTAKMIIPPSPSQNKGNWLWNSWTDNVVTHAASGWAGGLYKFGKAAVDLGGKVVGATGSGIGVIGSVIGSGMGWLGKAVTNPDEAYNDIVNSGQNAWDEITGVVDAAAGWIDNTAKRIADGTRNAITHPVETLQAIKQGVLDFAQVTQNTISSAVNGVINWVKEDPIDALIAGITIVGGILLISGAIVGTIVTGGALAPLAAGAVSIGSTMIMVGGAMYLTKRTIDFATQPSNESAWDESTPWDGLALVGEVVGAAATRAFPSGGAATGSIRAVSRNGDDVAKGMVPVLDDLASGADDLVKGSGDLVAGTDDAARVGNLLNTGDDVAQVGDDLAKGIDDISKGADDITKAGDDFVDDAARQTDDLRNIRVRYDDLLDSISRKYGEDVARQVESFMARYGDDAAKVLKRASGKVNPVKLMRGIERYKDPAGMLSKLAQIDTIDGADDFIALAIKSSGRPRYRYGIQYQLDKILEAQSKYGSSAIRLEVKISTDLKNSFVDIVTPDKYIEVKNWLPETFIENQDDFLRQMEKYFMDAAKTGRSVQVVSKHKIPNTVAIKLFKLAKSYGVRLEITATV